MAKPSSLPQTDGNVFLNKYGDMVCQYNSDTDVASFVTPDRYIKEPCNEMYYMKNSYGLSQKLSGDHNVLYRDRNKKFARFK